MSDREEQIALLIATQGDQYKPIADAAADSTPDGFVLWWRTHAAQYPSLGKLSELEVLTLRARLRQLHKRWRVTPKQAQLWGLSTVDSLTDEALYGGKHNPYK